MSVYLVNIFLTLIIASFAEYVCFVKKMGGRKKEISFFFLVIILGIWSTICAYRGVTVGSDTNGYVRLYEILSESSETFAQYMEGRTDRLFESLKYFCCKTLQKDWSFFAFVVAVITYFPVLYVLKKEGSEHFCFSLLIYIFLLQYYYGFNAMRQAVAIGVMFLGYNVFFEKNKYLQYAICAFLAFGFHSTAIFIVPIHFISKLKMQSKILWVIIGIFFVSAFAVGNIVDVAISALSFVGNDVLAERYAGSVHAGSGYLRVVVTSCPVIFGLWKYKLLKLYDDKIDQLLIVLIFSIIFMLFSTRNWLFARISAYCSIFATLFVPKLQYMFVERSRVVAKILIGILYFVYMIVLLLHGESGLYPYVFWG